MLPILNYMLVVFLLHFSKVFLMNDNSRRNSQWATRKKPSVPQFFAKFYYKNIITFMGDIIEINEIIKAKKKNAGIF